MLVEKAYIYPCFFLLRCSHQISHITNLDVPLSRAPESINNKATRVIIADDHPIVLIGLRMILTTLTNPTVNIIDEASTPEELTRVLERQRCDLLITDFHMSSGKSQDGLALIGFIRRNFPSIKVLVITMMNNPLILKQLLKLKINGLIDKNSTHLELRNAIRLSIKGHRYLSPSFSLLLDSAKRGEITNSNLSPKELEVMRLFGLELAGREIATRLNRSEKTISRQKRTAMKKLSIKSNGQLAVFCQSFL